MGQGEVDFIIRPRRSGKTTDMLLWLTEAEDGENRVLVVHSRMEKERLERWISDKNIPINPAQIIVAGEHAHLRGMNHHIAVDNLELLLYYMIGPGVVRVAATGNLPDKG
jgi:thymidine kinase